MPTSVKNSTALLASVIYAFFIVSHALRYEISHASSSRHESKPTLGWIIGTKYRFTSPHQQRRREMSTTIRVGRCTTHRNKRSISSRCRSKPCMMPLSDVGFEDVVPPTTTTLPSAGCTSTSSRATASAESSASSPTQQTSPLMETQKSGEAISAQLNRNTDARSKGRAVGAGNATPLATRAVMSSSSGGSVTSTQVAAVASADMADLDEAAQMDEGSVICKRIDAITREVEMDGQRILLRVATLEDYHSIADVRFSVFSPVHMTLRKRFRDRSCVLMKERRYRGSFCLVAVSVDSDAEGFDPLGAEGKANIKDGGRGAEVARHGGRLEHVLGTLECSKHEFEGTPLALEGDEISRLYLTEVAVREECRRLGLGSGLLTLVDDVARHLNTREVYLHVNEINEAAIRLYTRCGYEDAPNCPSSRAFTTKLGLSGGFYGQRHRLMRKVIAGAEGNDEDDKEGGDDNKDDDDETPPTESMV